jgi:hypothetical protein
LFRRCGNPNSSSSCSGIVLFVQSKR